jgi:hypothetical protein
MAKLKKGDRVAVLVSTRDEFGDEVDPLSLRLEWLTVHAVNRSAIAPEHDHYELRHSDGSITEYDQKYLISEADGIERRFQAIIAQLRKRLRK